MRSTDQASAKRIVTRRPRCTAVAIELLREGRAARRRDRGAHTCMLTVCPSPLAPPIVAVTTTSVSRDTKFRMHRSDFLCWPWGCAVRSNLRPTADGGHVARRQRKATTTEDMSRAGLGRSIVSAPLKELSAVRQHRGQKALEGRSS